MMVQVGQVVIARKRRADVLLAYSLIDETHMDPCTVYLPTFSWFFMVKGR